MVLIYLMVWFNYCIFNWIFIKIQLLELKKWSTSEKILLVLFWITHFLDYLSRCGVIFINQKMTVIWNIVGGKKNFNEVVTCAALEKKWVKDLPHLQLVVSKIKDQGQHFNLTIFFDSKLFIEKLLKMNRITRIEWKELQKKKIKQKRRKKKVREQQNHYVFNCNFVYIYIYIYLLLLFYIWSSVIEVTNMIENLF